MNSNGEPLILGPEEIITSLHHGQIPPFGSQRRCPPPIPQNPVANVAAGSLRDPAPTSGNNNNEPEPSQPALVPEPFVPISVRDPEASFIETALRIPNGSDFQRRRGRGGRGGGGGGFGRRGGFRSEQNQLTPEELNKLRTDCAELAAELKREEEAAAETDDPVEKYLQQVMLDSTVKIYSVEHHGYRILKYERSAKEKFEIQCANREMLEFVYRAQIGDLDWNLTDLNISHDVVRFVNENDETSFRSGAFSLAINFDTIPSRLTWRKGPNNQTILLRPVVIDGIAVQNASTNDLDRPFLHMTRTSRLGADIPYCHDLNLSVKPLFDVIMTFLLRGHKTTVYLPMYYKNYVTKGGISKVDDLVAFKALCELGFVEFREVIGRYEKRNFFKVMCEIADDKEAVFVSSDDYAPRTRDRNCDYELPSERILTPCFLNSEDRLMVIQPTIRYRDKVNPKVFHVIKSEDILNFKRDDPKALGEQLYLSDQIRLVCSLCQLYPMKSLHKIGIKQLLFSVIRAGSNFDMPSMTFDDFEELRRVTG